MNERTMKCPVCGALTSELWVHTPGAFTVQSYPLGEIASVTRQPDRTWSAMWTSRAGLHLVPHLKSAAEGRRLVEATWGL